MPRIGALRLTIAPPGVGRGRLVPVPDLRLAAHEADCCLARRDEHGRLPIGYCGPDCVRRP